MPNSASGTRGRHKAGTDWPLIDNFMGHAPVWYKLGLVLCLVANFGIYAAFGPFVTGWVILMQFIATLALALKSFPLLPGGLLFLQTILLGLVPLEMVNEEIAHNLPILFLVLFVVTAVNFLKDLLALAFMKAVLLIRSELLLALFFLLLPAVLSALLDALTVMAVVLTVFMSLYGIFHRFASERGQHEDHDPTNDATVREEHRAELNQFRAALRRLVMLAAIGTMLGGIMTLIGEPQNLLIGEVMGWHFVDFFLVMLPVSVPVLCSGIVTGVLVERLKWLDFGTPLSPQVLGILKREIERRAASRTPRETMRLWVQAFGAIFLVTALVLHVAEVYVIGLMLLIMVTAGNGATEHDIGEAVREGGPFVFVLAVFFGIVAMIHAQHLFAPVNDWILAFEGTQRLLAYYAATGALSSISDNVFVASLFITEAQTLHEAGTLSREEFEHVALAINMGTNVPSISTPNGQAAFLFLLMSRLAPLIKLSYLRMLLLALPFAVVCTAVGATAIWFFY